MFNINAINSRDGFTIPHTILVEIERRKRALSIIFSTSEPLKWTKPSTLVYTIAGSHRRSYQAKQFDANSIRVTSIPPTRYDRLSRLDERKLLSYFIFAINKEQGWGDDTRVLAPKPTLLYDDVVFKEWYIDDDRSYMN